MEPCEGVGFASHVFNTEATGIDRYSLYAGRAMICYYTVRVRHGVRDVVFDVMQTEYYAG